MINHTLGWVFISHMNCSWRATTAPTPEPPLGLPTQPSSSPAPSLTTDSLSFAELEANATTHQPTNQSTHTRLAVGALAIRRRDGIFKNPELNRFCLAAKLTLTANFVRREKFMFYLVSICGRNHSLYSRKTHTQFSYIYSRWFDCFKLNLAVPILGIF